jgi:hypothetical protein
LQTLRKLTRLIKEDNARPPVPSERVELDAVAALLGPARSELHKQPGHAGAAGATVEPESDGVRGGVGVRGKEPEEEVLVVINVEVSNVLLFN